MQTPKADLKVQFMQLETYFYNDNQSETQRDTLKNLWVEAFVLSKDN